MNYFKQVSIFFLAAILGACLPIYIYAQSLAGTYTGTYEGSPVLLTLQVNEQTVSGILNDGANIFNISGYAQAGYLVGTATEPKNGIQAIVAAELKGDILDFGFTVDGINALSIQLQRSSKQDHQAASSHQNPTAINPNNPNSPIKPQMGKLEPLLVGTWIKTVNSGGGYGSNTAYFSTEILFVINPNGSFEYGASRSVGGGSDWSYDASTWSKPELSGVLRSEGKSIYVMEANGNAVPTAQQNMGTYYIDGNNMAITSASGVKEYWQRR